MNLSQLKARTRALTVVFGDEALSLEYRPAAVTAAMVESVAGSTGAEQLAAVSPACEALIVSWDMTEGKKPYPPTAANLRALPLELLTTIFTAICEDCSPNRERPTDSSFS